MNTQKHGYRPIKTRHKIKTKPARPKKSAINQDQIRNSDLTLALTTQSGDTAMKYLLPLLLAISALTAPLANAEDGSKRLSQMLDHQQGQVQQDAQPGQQQ
tara:strand:- start:9 stop:311 length:303 start_codon:yes stop_codon:yes gene_type:complete